MIFFVFLTFGILKSSIVAIMKLSQRRYIKTINDSVFFVVLMSFFQVFFLFLIPPYYTYQVEYNMLIYPAAFSIFYLLSLVLLFNAFKFGPASLSSVIQNFNMFVPITIGLFLWHEKINTYQIIGLTLFVFTLFLFNNSSYEINDRKEQLTFKWLVITLCSTFVSGLAIFISKEYALVFTDSPKEYLILFNIIIVILGIVYFTYQIVRKNYKIIWVKRFIVYAVLSGFLLAAINVLFMLYIAKFDSAYFFPLFSIVGIMGVVVMGRLLLKERISKKAFWGVILSIIVIFLISIGK